MGAEQLNCSTQNGIGGAGKLLTHFERIYKPTNLIFYADKRWSDGGLYKNLEFTLIDFTKPGY